MKDQIFDEYIKETAIYDRSYGSKTALVLLKVWLNNFIEKRGDQNQKTLIYYLLNYVVYIRIDYKDYHIVYKKTENIEVNPNYQQITIFSDIYNCFECKITLEDLTNLIPILH